MLAHKPTTLIINPRDYQITSYDPIRRSVSQANLIDPSIASTKDPISAPPLQLYNADGSINYINHYYYYHHLAFYDKLDGAHREMFDDDGFEIPHFHHPVSSVNLEAIARFGQCGVTPRRDRVFKSLDPQSPILTVPKRRRRFSSDVLSDEQYFKARTHNRSTSIEDITSSSAEESSSEPSKRYFGFNWRSILQPIRRFSQSQSERRQSISRADELSRIETGVEASLSQTLSSRQSYATVSGSEISTATSSSVMAGLLARYSLDEPRILHNEYGARRAVRNATPQIQDIHQADITVNYARRSVHDC